MREKPCGQTQARRLEAFCFGALGAVLVVELESRVGTVADRVEW